jgi:hypothetical protein
MRALQADIMQLDVTWLYDDLEGNAGDVDQQHAVAKGSRVASPKANAGAEERALDVSLSLAQLNALRLPTYKEA